MSQSGRTPFPGNPRLQGLVSHSGTRLDDLTRSLVPRYGWVWTDVALRYLAMGVGLVAACAVGRGGNPWAFAAAPIFALWIGYWFASIVLFMHEGAHYNLHADKRLNDQLANWAVCPLIGADIASYRAVHWQHHLHLGETTDTEVSYFYAPTVRFLLETIFGVHALRVFRNHQTGVGQRNPTETQTVRWIGLGRGVVLHALLLGFLVWQQWFAGAFAWVLAVGLVFPYLSALRQQLEHRSLEASTDIDYSEVPHGAVNRMFQASPFSRTFGSAGFRRHLLHHWCPAVSYTNYDELETFFLDTKFRPFIEDARTSYGEVWRTLSNPAPSAG